MKIFNSIKAICSLALVCCLWACDEGTVEMTDIKVDPSPMNMLLGFRAQITALPVPLDATNQEFEWTSENTQIVTVNRYGIVDAIAEGSTNIIVKHGSIQKSIPVTVTDPVVIPPRAGSWLFDDASNIGKAEIGQTLVPIGTGFSSVDGPSATNKALRIDKGSNLESTHGIAPNGGGTKVNEYTLLFDFKVSQLGRWYTMYQTNTSNDDDGEVFINTGGAIGVGTTGYTAAVVEANKWMRLVVVVKLGEYIQYYVDGTSLRKTDASSAAIDDRFALANKVILFGDNDGDDAEIDVAEVAIWPVALDDLQVKKLGAVK